MKYPAPFPTSARPQRRPVHENRGSPGGAARRSHLSSTRLKQLIRVSPTWPVRIRAPPHSPSFPDGRPSLSCCSSRSAWVLLRPLHGGGTQSPICYCAHNLRWQVKWLTRPLGLLIQGSRTHSGPGWSHALHAGAGMMRHDEAKRGSWVAESRSLSSVRLWVNKTSDCVGWPWQVGWSPVQAAATVFRVRVSSCMGAFTV